MTEITGYIEWLCDCKQAGIIRGGPGCRKEPDPYDYAVAFKIVPADLFNGPRAVLKALIRPQGDARSLVPYARQATRLLAAEGLWADWTHYR